MAAQNTRAMKQVEFFGKKTVPSALRKDLWTPLCVLSFPNQLQGLNAYQKLREFKHLHAVSYPLDVITNEKGKYAGKLLPRKMRGKKLMDQKANSIADMAAVLAIQARPPTPEELERAERMVKGPPSKRNRPKPRKGEGSHQTAEVFEFRGKMDGVSIWWANTLDAEYAETWPQEVQHGPLLVNRRTAVWPPPEDLLLGGPVSPEEVGIEEGEPALAEGNKATA